MPKRHYYTKCSSRMIERKINVNNTICLYDCLTVAVSSAHSSFVVPQFLERIISRNNAYGDQTTWERLARIQQWPCQCATVFVQSWLVRIGLQATAHWSFLASLWNIASNIFRYKLLRSNYLRKTAETLIRKSHWYSNTYSEWHCIEKRYL